MSQLLIGVLGGLLLVYAGLLIGLWRSKHKLPPGEVLRLIPDIVRLLRRLAADRALPTGVRIRLLLLLAYLLCPIDLIPDFVPVLGYADDAIVVAVALRSVARRAGPAAIEQHWPGTPEALAVIRRFTGS